MSTSRYAGLGVVPPGELNSRSEFAPRAVVNVADLERRGLTVEYHTTQGERVDELAYRVLGDSRLFWVILDLNPQIDPLFLTGAEVLLLPRPGVLT
jgi:hypothetical protein